MEMEDNMRKAVCLLAAALSAVFTVGCGEGRNQEQNISFQQDASSAEEGAAAVADFGVQLLRYRIRNAVPDFPPYASMPQEVNQKIVSGENVLVSPLSVICALTMTANGAKGDTLAQMEDSFGMAVPELSGWLSEYCEVLPSGDSCRFNMANAIWLRNQESLSIEKEFLQKNEAFFGAGIYKAPFDSSTLKEINGWVKENTDGMIEEILDEIPEDAVLYLVNALAFDGEWEEAYDDCQVREAEFVTEDGTVQKADFMYSMESRYLEGEHGVGFLKYYMDRKYAFAALLPEEGMTVEDLAEALKGEELRGMLKNPIETDVETAIPKFVSEYSAEMNDALRDMGMSDAFDPYSADFSDMGHSGNGNLYIGRVLHKTYMAVDERGTKAGAATAVEMNEGGAIELEKVKTVYLDRPFLYMIVDCELGVPVFMGVCAHF